MALPAADGPTSPKLSTRLKYEDRGEPLDIILCIVNKNHQDTDERQIVIKHSMFPLMRDLYEGIWEVYPQFDPSKSCVYWRYNAQRFMPIYDYLSLRSAFILMADMRIYVIHLESKVDGIVYTRIPKFNFQAKKSDQSILRRAVQSNVSKQLNYFTKDSELQFKHLTHTIKGGDQKNTDFSKDTRRAESSIMSQKPKLGRISHRCIRRENYSPNLRIYMCSRGMDWYCLQISTFRRLL